MNHRGSLVGAVLGLALLSGCGVSTGPAVVRGDRQAVNAREVRARQDAAAAASRRAALPTRPPGVLTVAVRQSQATLARAIRRLDAAGSTGTFRRVVGPTDTGFEDLCAGRVDLLQSARRITAAELAQCEANGLEVRSPVVFGYATAVLVTRNGSDVGGDCLTLEGVRTLLGHGSVVRNWSQIGFDDSSFAVAAPPPTNAVVQTVGHLALGRPIGSVSTADFRGDLHTYRHVDQIGSFVAGRDRLAALDRQTSAYEQRIADERRGDMAAAIRRAQDRAARKVVAQIDRENQRREAAGQAVADPAALAAANAKRVAQAKHEATTARRAADRRVIAEAGARYRRAHLAAALSDGRLGVVSYPYYEAHSNALRPLEIDPRRNTAAGRPDCRFPSQQTITAGAYPLTLPLYVYGDGRTMRSRTGRILLRELVDHNAALTRANDVAGLSAEAQQRLRERFGLRQSTATTVRAAPSPATPSASPSTVPGVNATQDQP